MTKWFSLFILFYLFPYSRPTILPPFSTMVKFGLAFSGQMVSYQLFRTSGRLLIAERYKAEHSVRQ